MKNRSGLVSVTIVTYNSASFLVHCLNTVLAQDWPSLEVIVVDNASTDQTARILSRYQDRVHVILNPDNRGFAGGQNQAIERAAGDWILVLNPDALLTPEFVSCLVTSGNQDPATGTVCGKLYRALPDMNLPLIAELDSAGMFFTPTFRHFDRGMHETDGPQYSQPAYVFGATGAAALYRRTMIEDISFEGEFFDEDFFFSREDADVSWRAQLLGWKCLYVPDAVGYHVRRVFPGVRKNLPALINLHSVKNRFLMRLKNATPVLYLRNFIPVTVRDLGILLYCIMRERGSLQAFPLISKKLFRVLAKRRWIQQRRCVSESYLLLWFRFQPFTLPVPQSFSATIRPSTAHTPVPKALVELPDAGRIR